MIAEREVVSDSRLFVGDVVRVEMPRGHNKRGVWGISPLFTTSQEAKFDGATGVVVDVNPEGPYTIPLYLVDFRQHDNSHISLSHFSRYLLVQPPYRA